MCAHCDSHVSTVSCATCARELCLVCDSEVHAARELRQHQRRPVGTEATAAEQPSATVEPVTEPDAIATLPAAAAIDTADAVEPASDGESAPAAAVRMCAHCESCVASVHCDACAMDLCSPGCDDELHAVKHNSAHKRTAIAAAASVAPPLPAVAAAAAPAATSAPELCSHCSSFTASTYCATCSMHLCAPGCDGELHAGKRAAHTRVPYPPASGGVAVVAVAAPPAAARARLDDSDDGGSLGDLAPATATAAAVTARGSESSSQLPSLPSRVTSARTRPASASVGRASSRNGSVDLPAGSVVARPERPASSSRPSSATSLPRAGVAPAGASAAETGEPSPPGTAGSTGAGASSRAAPARSTPSTGTSSKRTLGLGLGGGAGAASSSNGKKEKTGAAAGASGSTSATGTPTRTRGSYLSDRGGSSVGGTGAAAGNGSASARPKKLGSFSASSAEVLVLSEPHPPGVSSSSQPLAASSSSQVLSVHSPAPSSSSSSSPNAPATAAAATDARPDKPEKERAETSSTTSAKEGSAAVPTAPAKDKDTSKGDKINYNYVLYSLRNKVTKLEAEVDELQGRAARAEGEAKTYSEAYTREQRAHRDAAGEAAREKAEKEAAILAARRAEAERDDWQARHDALEAQLADLKASQAAQASRAAEAHQALEQQLSQETIASDAKSSELSSVRSELLEARGAAAELKAQLAKEQELNVKYRLYSAQYEALIVTLREKLGEAERKVLAASKWKARAAQLAEEWDAERRKHRRKLAKQSELVETLRGDLRDFRTILKYVSVRNFVAQFLLRKALRRVFLQALELSTEGLIEQTEAAPKIHNSVQLDTKEELSTRNSRLVNEYPWGGLAHRRVVAAFAAAPSPAPATGSAASATAAGEGDERKGNAVAPRPPRRALPQLPPLTACVHSIAEQLHSLGESGALIAAQKRKWQECADAFFKRNIELTNSCLLSDQELLSAKKKSAALKAHSRLLQSQAHEREASLRSAQSERARLQSELEGVERGNKADKAASNVVHQAKFERSVELARRVQALQGELRALEGQKERLAKDLAAAESARGFAAHLAAQENESERAGLAAQQAAQEHLLGWGVRDGRLALGSPPTRGMLSAEAAPRPRSPARTHAQGVHPAAVPAPIPPPGLFEQEHKVQQPQQQGSAAGTDTPPLPASFNFSNVSRPMTASSSPATPMHPHSQPQPQSLFQSHQLAGPSIGAAVVVSRSAGRPVSSPGEAGFSAGFGSMSPFDYKGAGTTMVPAPAPMSAGGAAGPASAAGPPAVPLFAFGALGPLLDPYRGDAYSRGLVPVVPSGGASAPPVRHTRASARSAQFHRPLLEAYMPHVMAGYSNAAAAAAAAAATARPATSGGARTAGGSESGSSSATGPGIMAASPRQRASAGAGATSATQRPPRRRAGAGSSGGGGTLAPYGRPVIGSRAANLQAAALRKGEPRQSSPSPQRPATQMQEQPQPQPPAAPPVASLRDMMQQQ